MNTASGSTGCIPSSTGRPAQLNARVADLGGKFVKLTNLKLRTTTLYDLADHENEDDLPTVIDELAKHATKTRLSPADANA